MLIKSLDEVPLDELYQAQQDAFCDYERYWTKDEFERMLDRRGYVSHLSFGAFTESGQLVSFTLNGIGIFNTLKTAYDTSTGTIAAYRGKRLASQIFEHSVPILIAAGIRQYLLEVLQTNITAISLYQRQGFTICRELSYFIQPDKDLILQKQFGYQLQSISIEQLTGVAEMWEFTPSWQNSLEALNRTPQHFKAIGFFEDDKMVGYGVVEHESGDIPQIAIASSFRRRDIGSAILGELTKNTIASCVKVINSDSSCSSFTAFLEYNQMPVTGKQYEMIRSFNVIG